MANLSVGPSVHPPDACTVSKRIHIDQHFPPSGTGMSATGVTELQGELTQLDVKYTGKGKNLLAIFDRNCSLSRKRYEIGPCIVIMDQ